MYEMISETEIAQGLTMQFCKMAIQKSCRILQALQAQIGRHINDPFEQLRVDTNCLFYIGVTICFLLRLLRAATEKKTGDK